MTAINASASLLVALVGSRSGLIGHLMLVDFSASCIEKFISNRAGTKSLPFGSKKIEIYLAARHIVIIGRIRLIVLPLQVGATIKVWRLRWMADITSVLGGGYFFFGIVAVPLSGEGWP